MIDRFLCARCATGKLYFLTCCGNGSKISSSACDLSPMRASSNSGGQCLLIGEEIGYLLIDLGRGRTGRVAMFQDSVMESALCHRKSTGVSWLFCWG
jgi:hypothetical protein